ncbi:MAG: AAA family ATPase [Mycobacteriales bacterium]|nr:LuxR C-terminal-related transcriptional regulator [Frankia sp.]
MKFVGRAEELGALQAAASAMGTRAVVVMGEAGAGKSRLLAEAAASLASRHMLWVRGYEPEALAPLAAANSLLRELARDNKTLSRLLSGDTSAQLMQLFDVTYRALSELGPAAIVVDDVQWLDATTRALLHFVVRSAHDDDDDLLLLAAGRPAPVLAQMNEALVALLDDSAVTSVELSPLDRDSGIALVRGLDPAVAPEVAERHWAAASGSPFWLSMLARGGAGEAAPSSLVRTRLRSCSDDAATTLALLAVAARPLPADALADLLSWEPARVDAALSALVDRALATRRSGVVAAAHDLVREAVVADLGDDQRATLHARVADWLARDDEPAQLLAAMHHRAAARRPVADLALRTLATPRRTLLGGDGVEQIDRLLQHDGRARDVIPELAALATEIGEVALALPLWERAFDEGATERARATAAREAARAAYQLDRRDDAWRWLRTSRELSRGDDIATIRADIVEAHMLRWMDSRFDDAGVLATQVLSRARRLPLPEHRDVLVEALSIAYDDAMGRGDYVAITRLADEVADVARSDVDLQYTAARYRVSAFLLQGDARQAEPLARRHWRAATDAGRPARALQIAGSLIDALTAQGRVRDALEVATEIEPLIARAADLGRRFDTGIALTNVIREVHHVHALTGDWRPAVEQIAGAVPETGPHLGMTSLEFAATLTVLLGSADDVPRAIALSEQALELATEVGCARCGEETQLRAARVFALAGQPERARTLLAEREGSAGDDRPDVVRRWHRWASALVSAADGKVAAADEALTRLEADYEAIGGALDAAQVAFDRASVLARADPARAIGVLEEIARRCAEMGATNLLGVAQRRLRELGARPWRRGPTADDPLTEREQDIARLLATGATNPEIAARLFLSRKTVERHVSNVIAKLGVRNRTEVAARIAGPGRASESRNEGVPR